jgi:SAM-dependent MidA family methyltransferase
VTIQDGRFAWWRSEGVDRNLLASLGEMEAVLEHLPDGYVVEVSPAAESWWTTAARWLQAGLLFTCDYGMSAEDQLMPERTGGTLRAYHRHKISDKVLDMPGEQDLTAHVNFQAIIQAGEAEGLKTAQFQPQGRFLTRLVTEIPASHSFALPWDRARTRQFATLTHPDHLGQVFKVLVQSKGSFPRPISNS